MIARPRKFRVLLLAFAILAAGVFAACWFLLRAGTDEQTVARQTARAGFIETCKQQGRAANGGGALRMDDATEERLDQYCSCIADHFDQALNQSEITAIGNGTASQESLAKLNGVLTTCRVEHLDQKDDPAPTDN